MQNKRLRKIFEIFLLFIFFKILASKIQLGYYEFTVKMMMMIYNVIRVQY